MRYPRDRHTLDRRAQGVGAGYDGSAGQHEREVMRANRPNVAEALTPECSEVLNGPKVENKKSTKTWEDVQRKLIRL